jgi:hypothetical protein
MRATTKVSTIGLGSIDMTAGLTVTKLMTTDSLSEERRRKHVHEQLRTQYGKAEIMASKGQAHLQKKLFS